VSSLESPKHQGNSPWVPRLPTECLTSMMTGSIWATPSGSARATLGGSHWATVDTAPARRDPVALTAGIWVGIASSVIPYGADQLAMARLPRATDALMVSLLLATATIIGVLVLSQPRQGRAGATRSSGPDPVDSSVVCSLRFAAKSLGRLGVGSRKGREQGTPPMFARITVSAPVISPRASSSRRARWPRSAWRSRSGRRVFNSILRSR
jgi:hypothetical protein